MLKPNLGDTPSAQGSPNLPTGEQYVVVGFLDRPGERYWVPKVVESSQVL